MTTPDSHSEAHELSDILHALAHVLPAQAPIRDFVHHNTLHGFQHLPFEQALATVRQRLGLNAWMPDDTARAAWRTGRITDTDVHSALSEITALDAEARIAPAGESTLTRRDVYMPILRHAIGPISASTLAWRIAEHDVTGRVQDTVPPAARSRLLETAAHDGKTDERAAVTDLWQVCCDAAAPAAPAAVPEDRQDEGESAILWGVRLVKRTGTQLLETLLARVGDTWTLRDLLKALTGDDLLDQVREHIVRHAASHLDEGLAALHNPERGRGFYAAWRASAAREHRWILSDLPEWHQFLERLPDDATQAVIQELDLLGLAPAQRNGYLERLALEIPGWAGMFMWRSQHPQYGGLAGVPVGVMDYLAVRLALESIHAQRLCRAHWRIEASLPMLRWYFGKHPAELIVRHALYDGALPETLMEMAAGQVARARGHRNEEREQDWLPLAQRVPDINLGEATTGATARLAWPLFVLAQHLGLAGTDLRALGAVGIAALCDCLTRLDTDMRGYLWLLAYERNYRERIFAALVANHGRCKPQHARCSAQLVFCMDDREEGYRRHLEEIEPSVQTFGAAGFFGVAINWRGLDDARASALCPVVVTPAHAISEIPAPDAAAAYARHLRRRGTLSRLNEWLRRISHRGAVFGTVAAAAAAPFMLPLLAGRVLAPTLTGDLVARIKRRIDPPVPTDITLTAPDDAPPATPEQPRTGYTDAEQVARVAGLLRSIGLTRDFAPLAVIFGHGSASENNPHAAAYDCGACSGRHGGPNARAFAAMANRKVVRDGLAAQGIDIPADTWFIGAGHNTASDEIAWYDLERLPESLRAQFKSLDEALAAASRAHAIERCRRFASAPQRPDASSALRHVIGRGNDLSQARPELGHVTNACAFIGRRSMSRGAFFDRRAFLISYDPTQDPEGTILEAILLAAGPVGAGISLEYYFSTVNNDRLGCGTKIVHNITGFLGVMEGTASDLRTGLPKQMIEIHEAMRLLIVLESTVGIVNAIYDRQPILQELIGNGWVQLAVLDAAQPVLQWFSPTQGWQPWHGDTGGVEKVAASADWFSGHTGPLSPVLLDSGLPGGGDV